MAGPGITLLPCRNPHQNAPWWVHHGFLGKVEDYLPVVTFRGRCQRYLDNWNYGNQISSLFLVYPTFQQVSAPTGKFHSRHGGMCRAVVSQTHALNERSRRLAANSEFLCGIRTKLEKLFCSACWKSMLFLISQFRLHEWIGCVAK